MTARRMVRKAELDSVLASLKKAQMHARIEIEPGRMIVTTGQTASVPSTNPLDDMFS